MTDVMSIVIPIYKRLNSLPGVLQAVARQDYPHIDLIVSDNGGLSEKAKPIIDQLSELVGILQRRPDVSVANARQEMIDEEGRVLRQSARDMPEFMSGEESIHAWTQYGFECYATVLMRTRDAREVGCAPRSKCHSSLAMTDPSEPSCGAP
jgi:Glycosyl transferase family 2